MPGFNVRIARRAPVRVSPTGGDLTQYEPRTNHRWVGDSHLSATPFRRARGNNRHKERPVKETTGVAAGTYDCAVRRSERLRQDAAAIERFEGKFLDLVDVHQPVKEWPLELVTWVPKPGCELEAAQIRADVDLASGPATAACARTGVTVALTATHFQPAMRLIPTANWSKALDDPHSGLTVDGILNYTRSVRGQLQQESEDAAAAERGIIGALGRFVALPYRIREASGVPRSRGAQRAAFGIGVFVQGVVIAVVGGVLVALFLAVTKV